MSFDSEFDYTGSITFIDDTNTTTNSQISAIVTKLSDLGNLESSFDYLVNPEITALNQTKTIYDNVLNDMLNLKSNIQIIIALSTEDKANLYSLYTDVISETTETKQQWMCRMVHNSTEMVSDAENFIAGNLSVPQKGLVAELICQKYPISGRIFKVRHTFE